MNEQRPLPEREPVEPWAHDDKRFDWDAERRVQRRVFGPQYEESDDERRLREPDA